MQTARRGWIAGVAGAGLLVAAWWLWGAAPRALQASAPTQPTAATSIAAPAPSTSRMAPADAAPRSQRGTVPDGGVRFDAHGDPIADAELRRLFDWYLGALGEQNLATLRARLRQDLALRMTPAQAAAVLALFDRYVDYQQASTRLAGIGDLGERLRAVHALRVRMLGDTTAAGFFGEEETEAQRVLALQEAARAGSTGASDAVRRAQTLAAASPGYVQARDEAALHAQVADLDAQFAREHVGAAERHAERSALFGADAADRFADLDRQRADWNARVAAYARQRDALAQRSDLDPARRQAALRRLLAPFSAAEQRRIAALTEAGALR